MYLYWVEVRGWGLAPTPGRNTYHITQFIDLSLGAGVWYAVQHSAPDFDIYHMTWTLISFARMTVDIWHGFVWSYA